MGASRGMDDALRGHRGGVKGDTGGIKGGTKLLFRGYQLDPTH